ncbi:rRNA-processing protein cgr1 [Lecanora helva]
MTKIATATVLTDPGLRKNGLFQYQSFVFLQPFNLESGKQWHPQKSAFRPKAGQTSYEKRTAERIAIAATKAKEKEMKDEKEEERQRRIQAIKDKRAAKEEKERYEKMAEKMHRKRVERLKRREKRNKLLKS